MNSILRRLALVVFVAHRIVRSRRSNRLSVVTLISIVGVAFGVMALTVVLGVTGGFQGAFEERILGLYPHLVVLKRGRDFREYPDMLDLIRATPGVAEASPATYDDMMMAAGIYRAGAVVKGVELSTVREVLGVEELLVSGQLSDLSEEATVRCEGDRVLVERVTTGLWLTILCQDGGAGRAFVDDGTPPDPGNGRISVLDLRGGGPPLDLILRDVNPEPTRAPIELMSSQGALASAREVTAGLWRVEPLGEVIEVGVGQLLTLVVRPGNRDPMLLVEASSRSLPEGRARARVLDLRTSGAPLRLGVTDGSAGDVMTHPGEFTGYHLIPARAPGAILGVGLAERLHANVGDEVSLVTPLRGVDNKMLGPYGMKPTSARVRVMGLFESGFHEYDVRLALMNIQASQRILNRGPVIRWIEVRAEDLMEVEAMKRQIAARIDPFDLELLSAQTNALEGKIIRYLSGDVRQARAESEESFIGGIRNAVGLINLLKYQEVDLGYRPDYRLIDWREMNTNLFSALKLQKVVLTIFFLIIIIVGSFVVVGSQIMVIHEKTADIAILRTMGATAGTVRAIFTVQGLLVAGIGTAVGMSVGLMVCAVIAGVDYPLDAAVYLIDRLPIQLSPWDLVVVATATAACTLAATQYSARRAAAKTPVDGLRSMD